ncbi:MAG: O-antigen ligase family protein [Bacteroidales bacterium]|nr:O-antigen ligase family protein [Candidatus Colimorpha onthohippi]
MRFHFLPGLNNYQRSVLIATALSVVAIVSYWRIGICALTLLAVCAVVKIIASKKIGNPALSKPARICLYAMVAYWMLYVISACYSQNHAEGWNTVAIKVLFLVLPLLLIAGDTRYVTHQHLRGLLAILVATLCIRFAICVALSVWNCLHGMSATEAFRWNYDPLGLHHNYLALYILVAEALLYVNLVSTIGIKRCRWIRWSSVLAAVILSTYLYMSGSRSGIAALLLLIVACLIHLAIFKRQWVVALAAALFVGIFGYGLSHISDTISDRYAQTAEELSEGTSSDVRLWLLECGLETAKQELVFGYGSGDYELALKESYIRHGYIDRLQNLGSHNQYLETVLETGLIGLAVLLIMLLLPTAIAIATHRNWLLCAAPTLAVMSQIFFESMLNRQMGVQLITLLYCIMIVGLSISPTCNLSRHE